MSHTRGQLKPKLLPNGASRRPLDVLQTKYPELGADVIEQVFMSNNCKLESTENVLQNVLGAKPKLQQDRPVASSFRSAPNNNWDKDEDDEVQLIDSAINSKATLSHIFNGAAVNGTRLNNSVKQDDHLDLTAVSDCEDGEAEDELPDRREPVRWNTSRDIMSSQQRGVDNPLNESLCSYYNVKQQERGMKLPNVKVLIVMRGLPGSGKSTRAREILNVEYAGFNGQIFSADDYYVNRETGAYTYNRDFIGRAHLWNRTRASQAAHKGVSPIIIDNTNTMMKEMKPYLSIAKKYGYVIEIEETATPWRNNPKVLAKANTHGVDEQTITFMQRRFEHIFDYDQLFAYVRTPVVPHQSRLINIPPTTTAGPALMKPSHFQNINPMFSPISPIFQGHPRVPVVSQPVPSGRQVSFQTGSNTVSGSNSQNRNASSSANLASDILTATFNEISQSGPVTDRQTRICSSDTQNAQNETESREKGAVRKKQSQSSEDNKVQEWVASQLTNLSVQAPQFKPTASTYVKKSTSNSQVNGGTEIQLVDTSQKNSIMSEDEEKVLNIFPDQSLENVRNLLIANNGSVEMALEALCDLSVQESKNRNSESTENKSPSVSQSTSNQQPSSSTVCSSSFADSQRVPSLKSLALKAIDTSLSSNNLGLDALLILNSSVSDQDRSLMSLSVVPKEEPSDIMELKEQIIDILDSDSESEDMDVTASTVIGANVFNSTVIPAQGSNMSPLDRTLTTASSNKSTKFILDTQLAPGLTKTLLEMFGTFSGWTDKPKIHLNADQLRVIYDAWKCSPAEIEPVSGPNESKEGPSVVEVVQITQSPSPTKNEDSRQRDPLGSLVDISTTENWSPGSERSSGASPKAKKMRKPARMNLLKDFNQMGGACESFKRPKQTSFGSNGAVTTLSDIMDQEQRAERSLAAQKEAMRMVASIDNRADVGNRTSDKIKLDHLVNLFPRVSKDIISDVLKDLNYSLNQSIEVLSMQFGEPPAKLLNSVKKAPCWSDVDRPVDEDTQERGACAQGPTHPNFLTRQQSNEHRSFQAFDNPDYRDLRAEANMYRRLREQELEKARMASGPDKAMKSQHYARKAFEYGELMKEANQRAALVTLEQNNDSLNPNVLDLHKLHVDEAKVAVKNYLLELNHPSSKQCSTLKIITGWGKHSNGRSRIKPEIEKLLTDEGFKFQWENRGSFIVYLK